MQTSRPPYGVYVFEDQNWHQVSAHWRLIAAQERALEANDLIGGRVRIRTTDGLLVAEFEEKRRSPLRRKSASIVEQ